MSACLEFVSPHECFLEDDDYEFDNDDYEFDEDDYIMKSNIFIFSRQRAKSATDSFTNVFDVDYGTNMNGLKLSVLMNSYSLKEQERNYAEN